jgi:hypothetical protein
VQNLVNELRIVAFRKKTFKCGKCDQIVSHSDQYYRTCGTTLIKFCYMFKCFSRTHFCLLSKFDTTFLFVILLIFNTRDLFKIFVF